MFKKLLLFFTILVILYYIYICINNVENFANPEPTKITETQNVDLNTSINALGQIAKDLQDGAGLKVKGKLIVDDTVTIGGKAIIDPSGNMTVNSIKIGNYTIAYDDTKKGLVIDNDTKDGKLFINRLESKTINNSADATISNATITNATIPDATINRMRGTPLFENQAFIPNLFVRGVRGHNGAAFGSSGGDLYLQAHGQL